MENYDYNKLLLKLEVFSLNNRVYSIPGHLFIKEGIEEIKKELEKMNVLFTDNVNKIEELASSCNLIFFNNEFEIEKVFDAEKKFFKREFITIRGLDDYPVIFNINDVKGIVLTNLADFEETTVIFWKGGGCTHVDSKYFLFLKKYWIKKVTSVNFFLFFTKDKDPLDEKIKSIDGLLNLYQEYLSIEKEKIEAVKNQNFEKAAEKREKEKMLLGKIESIIPENFDFFSDEFFKDCLSNI
jgi:hypothetical protein